MTSERTHVITDWRTKNEDELPDLAFGEDYERRITPQTFVVLHRIILQGRFLHLVSLRIGALPDVPFELEPEEDGAEIHQYRPKVDQEPIKQLLVKTGAAAVGSSAIAIPPGMDVLLVVRNGGVIPVKPRAAIVVQEERR